MLTAVVTGAGGQDGSLLSEYLVQHGYRVVGVVRRRSTALEFDNLKEIIDDPSFVLVYGDITDPTFISRVLHDYHPHEWYNLAAMSLHPDIKVPLKRSGKGIRFDTLENLWNDYSKVNKIRKETVQTEGGVVDCEVIDINTDTSDSNLTKALGYKFGMGVWKPIYQISRHYYKGTLIRLKQKWGEVIVTPNHSLYNNYGRLVRPIENPELFPVRKINYLSRTFKKDINLSVCLKDLVYDEKWVRLNKGKNKVRISLSSKDNSLQSFLRFCGAYISEGWIYSKNRKRYSIFISQKDKTWLEKLQKDLSAFYTGKSWISKDKKDVYTLEVSSKILYYIMKKYCNHMSENKHMPSFIFDISPENRDCLLKTLFEGDGSFDNQAYWSNEKITQTSERLSLELGLLFADKNWDYTIDIIKKPGFKKTYTIRRTRIYQFGHGEKEYEEIPYEGWVYDIGVFDTENFACGVGNILVHNSHVGQSFKEPVASFEVNASAVINQLESIRQLSPYTRYYNAATSEMFGGLDCPSEGYNEEARLNPRSPYAVAKVAAFHATRNYREAYELYACSGILFNHSSRRRGYDFATRKITRGLAAVKLGKQKFLRMGNLEAYRDESHAKDMIEGMHLMLQQNVPDDYVLASGESHSIKEMFQYVCELSEQEFNKIYLVDERFIRPSDVPFLLGDASKAREKLGWNPSYNWKSLLKEMYEHDLQDLSKE